VPNDVQRAVEELWEQWVRPPHPHYIFLVTDLASPSAERNSDIREVVERITGMPTIVGNEIRQPDLQAAIMRTIKEAFLVIADVTGATEGTFNLDCCIEVGMALANDADIALERKGNRAVHPSCCGAQANSQLTPTRLSSSVSFTASFANIGGEW